MSEVDPVLAAKKRRHRNERIFAAILVLVLSAAVVWFLQWNRREEEALRRDLRYIPKREKITPEVLLLRDYVRIDTSTAEGAAKGARWIAALLKKHGIEPQIIESTPGRLNVYARIKGRNPGHGLLLFNHIDVVAADASQWTHPPFGGEIHLNQLWGRGTLDIKALAICQILALAEIVRGGQPPAHDLVFLATAEEEEGSWHGMQWLLVHRPDLFEGVEYAVTEGGITEIMTERMTYFGIEVGGKLLVRTRLYARDAESLRQARIALEPFMTSHEAERVLPEVRNFFRQLAPTRIAFRPYLADIDGTIARGEVWRLPSTYRHYLQNLVVVWAPHREENEWAATALLVNLPDEDPDARIAWLEKIAAPYGVRVHVDSKEGPVPFSSHQTRIFSVLAAEAAKRYRVPAGSQLLYRSASDCRFLRPRGIDCYGISPYRVDISQSVGIHRENERIRLDWYIEGVEYMKDVVRTWASTD